MVLQCRQCGDIHDYKPEEFHWDFRGYGYDTKYVVCPECGAINIVHYYLDKNFDVNNDERFYAYGVANKEEN